MTAPEAAERVYDNGTGEELAVVIRASFGQRGINFVTRDDSAHPLQNAKLMRTVNAASIL